MDLRQLKIFCLLAEKLSFSKVAEQLKITQPTVSFQIKGLEKNLGVRLVERTTKKINLTNEGKLFYDYACKVLELNKALNEEFNEIKGIRQGSLSIAASNIPGIFILPAYIARFKKKFPGITINLDILDSQQVIDVVLEEKADIGVTGFVKNNSQLIFEKLIKDELVLIAGKNHPWAKRKFIQLDDLKKEPLILREEGSGTRESLKESLSERKIRLAELNIIMRLGNNEAIKKTVETGMGVSFISKFSVKNELELNLLKIIPIKNFTVRRFFHLVYNQFHVSPSAKAFRSFLLDKISY